MPFGKYKGEILQDVIDADPEYVKWMVDNIPTFDLDTIAMDCLDESLNFMLMDEDDYCRPDLDD